ncbi:MAG: peptide deformylase [Oscillospiraceae bacterium]|nr:peptide deformylase [Oscillospiraceae bacterium]
MHDEAFLALPARPATAEDAPIAKDLLDTLFAHRNECVGMAANMIGEAVAIICFENDGAYMTMFNPVITEKRGAYSAEESCLSWLGGPRSVKRYAHITVQYQTAAMRPMTRSFSGFSAQIIQHEADHLAGILI